MSTIKVLVVPSDRSGVSKFRSVDPHLKLQELYGDDFFVEIVTAGTDGFDWDNDSFIKGFDVEHYHSLKTVNYNQLIMMTLKKYSINSKNMV
jgi:hypothetical protein